MDNSIRNNEQVLQTVLATLNSAYHRDPSAIHALMCNRVPCNDYLANHPHVVVQGNKALVYEFPYVGTLGLINGILSSLGVQKVAMEWDDSVAPYKFIGFVAYKEPSV